MTVHLVTFASDDMEHSVIRCVESALKQGADLHWYYSPDIIKRFPEVQQNADLFGQSRGCGYWAWKPMVINEAMSQVSNDNYIIYADAGIEFIGDVNEIISRMDQDIFLFGNNWEHAHWCKRDVLESVWPLDLDQLKADPRSDDESMTFGEWWRDRGWDRFGKQCQASVIFFRVSDYSRKFVKEWLDWCLFEGGRLIDDSPSRTLNHPEFQENRHDQAILTTMAYRDGLKLHWWPASYNDGQFVYEKLPVYASDNYPVMFNHHRKRNHEWSNAA